MAINNGNNTDKMANFFETLLEVLRADNRFFTEDGTLLRNKVYESALNMDATLISLLLNNAETKKRFFVEVNGIFVFDKVGFGWVVNNRQFLPDSYTRFKNRIGLTDSRGDLISTSNDVVLSFPYKDCVLEGGQTKEDQKRSEVFYNTILAPDEVDRLLSPKVMAGAKRFTASGVEEGITFNENDNLIIKGNNLLAITSLLKRYEGKVKCIFIDPPYNTESDSFGYNDSFSHSTWLVFMKNRLEIVRRLLRKDGIMIIITDEIEQAYLKVLADEIFGRDCFIGDLIWQKRKGGGNDSHFIALDHDYLAIYVRDKQIAKLGEKWRVQYDEKYLSRYKLIDEKTKIRYYWDTLSRDNLNNPIPITIEAPDGTTISINSQSSKTTVLDGLQKGNIRFVKGKEGWTLHHKVFQPEGKVLRSILKAGMTEQPTNKYASDEIETLFAKGAFKNPKPEGLMKSIIDMVTDEGDTVLDFHLGSGTTCAVAHKMGRHYIGVEQMDYVETVSIERLKKVVEGEQGGISQSVNWNGGGSFVYCELAKSNQCFVDELAKSKTDDDLIALLKSILKTGFISSKVNPADIGEGAEAFAELAFDDKKRFILDLLDKNMLYVNLCDLEDEEYAISDADKAFTKSFYRLEDM